VEAISVDLLQRATSSARSVLATVSADQLTNSTPCASWDVRALINHIVGSTYWFADTVESGVAPASDHGEYQPDITGGDIIAAFDAGAGRALTAFGAAGALDKTLKLPFGKMPASAFAMMAANDQLQHAWDLAKATGQPTGLDLDLAAQLLAFATAAIPDAFRGPDGVAPFGPAVPVPEDAPINDRLAAFLGRQP
jgi:uncharacterized protein (TIGR03086 family)